ncbi:MAG: hypothetical protein U0N94_02905 [Clostridia bacterium]
MQKLLQISAGVFFMASGAGHQVCASKRRTKGLRGAERKPRRRCSEGKRKIPAPGLRIKTENKGIAGSRAQTAPALQQEKKENFGFGFAHQNGE